MSETEVTTPWRVVLGEEGNSGSARATLEQLCRAHRTPVFAYICHRGYRSDVAEDLTQAFFARVLEHAWLADVNPARGSFRTFLLTAVKRFVMNAEQEGRTLKRGGNMHFESIDGNATAIQGIASDDATPERAFERAWAMAILDHALRRMRDDAVRSGKAKVFDRLRDVLIEGPGKADYAELAVALNLRRNTLAVTVHRLRRRLRDVLGEELAATNARGCDIMRELEELRAALGPAIPAFPARKT